MKNLLMGSEMDPQSNLLKYFPYLMNGIPNLNSNMMTQDILNPITNPSMNKNTLIENSKSTPLNPQNIGTSTHINPINPQLTQDQKNRQYPLNQTMWNGLTQSLPSSNSNNNTTNLPDYSKLLNLNYLQGVSNNTLKPGFFNNGDMDIFGRGLLDSIFTNNSSGLLNHSKKGTSSMLENSNFEDSFFIGGAHEMYNKIKEKNKYERSLKIEKYKNKKRNWAKKISYDCRKRVADIRLRIKGRFISKIVKKKIFIYYIKINKLLLQDSEKINKLVEGKQEEAFNDKKNLKIDYITSKFNLKRESNTTQEEIAASIIAQKPNITKRELLIKIDEILNNKGDVSPVMSDKITQALKFSKKKIFKIKHYCKIKPIIKDVDDEIENLSSNNTENMKQLEDIEQDVHEQTSIKKEDNSHCMKLMNITTYDTDKLIKDDENGNSYDNSDRNGKDIKSGEVQVNVVAANENIAQ